MPHRVRDYLAISFVGIAAFSFDWGIWALTEIPKVNGEVVGVSAAIAGIAGSVAYLVGRTGR